jgi:hypothetical protein
MLLQTPAIEGATDGPAVWTVYIPTGYEMVASDSPRPLPGPARSAKAALFRADAKLRVSAALTETAREGVAAPLVAAQQRFYFYCRQAEQALQDANESQETGPSGESLAQWLRTLLDENRRLARERDFEETRVEADHRSDAAPAPRSITDDGEPAVLTGLGQPRIRGPLPDSGTPAYLALSAASELPALRIRPVHQRRTRELLVSSALWLGLLSLAAAVVLLPGLSARLRWFWPDPLLLLGLLSWYLTGLTPFTALFLVLGVVGRMVALVDAGSQIFRSRAALAPGAVASRGATGSGS